MRNDDIEGSENKLRPARRERAGRGSPDAEAGETAGKETEAAWRAIHAAHTSERRRWNVWWRRLARRLWS